MTTPILRTSARKIARRIAKAEADYLRFHQELGAIIRLEETRFGLELDPLLSVLSLGEFAELLDVLSLVDVVMAGTEPDPERDAWLWRGIVNNVGTARVRCGRHERSTARYLAKRLGVLDPEDDVTRLYPAPGQDRIDVNPFRRRKRGDA